MDAEQRSGCPINLTLEVVGDKWSLLIIRDMIFGNRRHFRELLTKSEEGIASNILADRLKTPGRAGHHHQGGRPDPQAEIGLQPHRARASSCCRCWRRCRCGAAITCPSARSSASARNCWRKAGRNSGLNSWRSCARRISACRGGRKARGRGPAAGGLRSGGCEAPAGLNAFPRYGTAAARSTRNSALMRMCFVVAHEGDPPVRAARRTQPRARPGRRPAGRALRALLLHRHPCRPRDRPCRSADLGALLHAAAEGPRLQQQRGAHLPAVPHRRPCLQARRQDHRRQPAAGLALRAVAHRPEVGPDRAVSLAGPRLPQHRKDRARADRDPLPSRRRDRAPDALLRGVAAGIQNLDEHWDGGGQPLGLAGAAIPVYSRASRCWPRWSTCSRPRTASKPRSAKVASPLRRLVRPAARRGVRARRRAPAFWDTLRSEGLQQAIFALEPAQRSTLVDEDYLDDIAAAFAQVVDSKSPLHQRAQRARHAVHRPDRGADGTCRRASALAQARRTAARHRQARREQFDPRQAGQARRGRMEGDAAARRAHRDDPVAHRGIRRSRGHCGRAS